MVEPGVRKDKLRTRTRLVTLIALYPLICIHYIAKLLISLVYLNNYSTFFYLINFKFKFLFVDFIR